MTGCFGRFCSRSAICAMPSLLNPKRLITARSLGRRNNRGLGLPGCATGVAAPSSRNPKPQAAKPFSACAFLSNPAAKPIGFGNASPASCAFRRGKLRERGFGTSPICRALIARLCARSGSRLCKTFKPSCSKFFIPTAPEIYGTHL